MAKKKTHKKSRKVGAMALSPSSTLMKWGPILAGYFLADKINTPIDTALGGKIDSKIIGAAEGGLGFLLVFGKGKKSLPKSILGGLLLGAGAKRLLKDFGVMGGFHDVPVVGSPYRVPVLGAYRVPPTPVMGAYRVPPRRNGVMAGVNSDNSRGSGLNRAA